MPAQPAHRIVATARTRAFRPGHPDYVLFTCACGNRHGSRAGLAAAHRAFDKHVAREAQRAAQN